ncbi:hypothetical protein [Brevibacillus laterosporus]|uniref:hypothetical protein n=1 Tax=Brevibacillus laterosporus TaxID=1465 RepID=UPI0018CD5A54|nr:hypothetical protein [Brevibacillus laterosporus]MBG9798735.1 hypothetical protein [Brevibacillus laterosporus]MED1910478.1 hypothetical protein [Brevibacillus laterosporus]
MIKRIRERTENDPENPQCLVSNYGKGDVLYLRKKEGPFEANNGHTSSGIDLYKNEIRSKKCHKLKFLGYKFMIICS